MLRKLLVAGFALIATSASAQIPAVPASQAPATRGPASPAVPTYWVLMVTGEKDGAPWIKTTTPETLGGTVKGTGPWTCTYPATTRGSDENFGFEEVEVACGIGEAEVFMNLRCSFRNKARPGKIPGKGWKRSELQTLNLRRKGDVKSTITVSLRCDVDAAFSAE